jgi:hypothetical protein
MLRKSLTIALVILILVLPGLAFYDGCSAPPSESRNDNNAQLKAAIIDQLYTLQPNQAFIDQTVEVLNDYGFEVDVYSGNEVTVDLYRKLPSYGYKLILFRAHSGIMGSEGQLIKRTFLFTSEPYSETEHFKEQLLDQLAKARIDENHPFLFAISTKFIDRSMEGQFAHTAIIMMGCSCLYIDDMAQAFIKKGASTYIAWDASVSLSYTDGAIAALVEKLCSEGLTVGQAVAETMNEKGLDPDYRAVLKYYPPQSGDKTLSQLIE